MKTELLLLFEALSQIEDFKYIEEVHLENTIKNVV